MWRNGCPKSRERISSGPTSEAHCAFEFCEHNVENMSTDVIGQDKSSNVGALFLEDRELRRVALSCHMTINLLCQESRGACWENSDSMSSPRSQFSDCLEERRRCSDALFPYFIQRPGLQAGHSFELFVPSPK